MKPSPALVALAVCTVAALAPAQFVDGELIVDTYLPGTGTALLRVDPTTGTSQILIGGYYRGGWAGGLVYDGYRDGLIASTSLPPDPYWLNKLWFIDANGSATAMAGISNLALRGLCTAGDGRIFYQEHNPTSDEIRYLDANDQVHTLLDASGAAPFVFRVEHMLYHAASNSLLATTSGGWTANHCAPSSCSIFRIPLAANGTRVAGPPLCASVATASQEIMSIDYLPDGDVLMNLASGTSPVYPNLLLRVDPVTLAISAFASPSLPDLNGGYFCPAIGQAVVLDDWSNTLRLFPAGSSGGGTVLPTTHVVSPTTTGYSPMETMWRVDRNGPACQGSAITYGAGLAGAGGLVPTLGVAGCPAVGTAFSITADEVVGGTLGLFAMGAPSSIPLLGGSLLVSPVFVTVVLPVNGTNGAPGAGSASLPMLVNDPGFLGVSIFLQALFLDAAAPAGVSMSNGLQIVFG